MHPAAAQAQNRLRRASARYPRRDNQAVSDDANATILVVDDDRALREALRRVLALDGYEVRIAEGGAEALDAISSALPDAVVLDVGMPGIDGLEVCRRLRRLQNRVPVLILTARDAIEDRIDGLDVGADDYMVKPFDVGELRARLRALLRRSGMSASEDGAPLLSLGEVTLESQRHGAVVRAPGPAVVAREGANGSAASERFVELTRTEYLLLELFISHPREVLSHSTIYEHVWGYDFGPSSNSLRVYVGYLRRKLEGAGARPLIHNVRGVGYVMREP